MNIGSSLSSFGFDLTMFHMSDSGRYIQDKPTYKIRFVSPNNDNIQVFAEHILT